MPRPPNDGKWANKAMLWSIWAISQTCPQSKLLPVIPPSIHPPAVTRCQTCRSERPSGPSRSHAYLTLFWRLQGPPTGGRGIYECGYTKRYNLIAYQTSVQEHRYQRECSVVVVSRCSRASRIAICFQGSWTVLEGFHLPVQNSWCT